jgi:serine/threonine-protein kinase
VDRTSIDQTLDLVQEALGDRYLVTGPLAQGGMSLLLRGRQTLLDQPVAIKVMHANAVGHRALRERFLREARILASLQVPQITRVYDAGSLRDGRLYLVLELLQGENLETISERGPMPLSLAARVLMEVCDGLIAAHDKGIIHRDLKPENVFMVQREDGTLVVKLLDFGIAKDTADQKDVTGTYTIVGSPLYVPPEQIASSRTVDKRADIWAMGVMLYQLVLQRHPFEDASLALLLNKIQNEPLPPFPPDSDPMFEIIVERCLAKNPEERYGSANELKDALVTLAEQLPQQHEELDDMPTLGPRMAPIGLGLGMAHLATERPPMSEQPSSGGAPSSGNDMTLHVPVPGSPGMPQIVADQRPVTAPIGLQVQHHGATAPSLQTPPELGTQPQGQRQSSPPPEVRTPEPQPVPQHLQQVQQGQAQPQNQRIAQKTIPIGRPFMAPPPSQQQQAPQDSHVPRAPRGGMTAPLMQPFTLPQGPPGAASDPRAGSSPGMAAQPVPTFAEPLPDPRRQAPTVVVPRKNQRPMWPFVALGVAIVLAMVAVAMVLKR